MRVLISALAVAAVCLSMPHTSMARQDAENRKAVLITGASSGIGRNMAETLAREGFFVYAGARKQDDIDALSAIDNVMGVRLDVNIQDDIDVAVALVESEGRGLYGLVNNAGVGVLGPLIEVDEEDLWFQMNVNVFGPYRVTKAFAPLIIESQGRITTTGSISGILSGFMFGPYSMSKHAIEAYTDSLSLEMRKFGVEVSVIEPGNYRSSIVTSLLERMEARGQSSQDSRYQEEIEGMLNRFQGEGYDAAYYKEPDEVSQALLDFLTDDNPKQRYMVVPEERQAEITIRRAIAEMTQLNERQAYTYDRDELVAMLDEALAALERQ